MDRQDAVRIAAQERDLVLPEAIRENTQPGSSKSLISSAVSCMASARTVLVCGILEHFPEKWASVFRKEMRQCKDTSGDRENHAHGHIRAQITIKLACGAQLRLAAGGFAHYEARAWNG
jgi:hypothetical protein